MCPLSGYGAVAGRSTYGVRVARSAYVAGLDPAAGKSVIALGVAELLSRRVGRLGVFRPLVAAGAADHEDPVLGLLRHRYGVSLPYDRLYGVTYPEAAALLADGRGDDLVSRVVERYRALSDECDAVVVIGSDLDQEGLHLGLTFNAELAMEFGSVLLPVLDGRPLTPAEAANAVNAARHELREHGVDTVGVIVNRVPPGRLDEVRAALGDSGYAIPEVPELTRPTVAEVGAALGAKCLLGDDSALARDVHGYVVGGALVPVVLDHLTDGALVITPGDRADLIVASYTAHAAGAVSLAGIVLTLGEAPDPRAVALVERLNTGLALLLAADDSFATVVAAGRIEPKLRADNPRKVAAALGAFEAAVDPAALADRIAVSRSTRVTPLMFEYELIGRAHAARRRIVLPEGAEERILRAAEVLLRRQVADLTLLGDPAAIEQRARELGLDLSAATVVDPATSPWLDEFARSYAQLRAHRAVTLDQARDRVSDVSYFGTMMVHLGYADAMVSGAVHTTAATIRPAFEIIRTVPGLSVASSVFFMCLSDRVLVYGDCAINPDPDAAQLADIAISSADTAARFGVQPRVAMLSYSTGASGTGADVDKVAAATALVRERRPDLPVEGPIQYDAAVDPAVAATKLPGSAVAGNATVLIFPDLNTGNNTYKAVQRSAHAIAIGPVLQGLRKPVNDLSRGATVRDIVNTVAITAIQAAS
jgi:phosphate acetyltransferase